ncbi:MAG: acyl-CoA thioesterase, partial [Chloroflexi bacterium]
MDAYPFAYRQRVRYGETDLQQVVYYANYLLYAEVG